MADQCVSCSQQIGKLTVCGVSYQALADCLNEIGTQLATPVLNGLQLLSQQQTQARLLPTGCRLTILPRSHTVSWPVTHDALCQYLTWRLHGMCQYADHLLHRLDELLGGGLREGQLTELYGESASGKTQVCTA